HPVPDGPHALRVGPLKRVFFGQDEVIGVALADRLQHDGLCRMVGVGDEVTRAPFLAHLARFGVVRRDDRARPPRGQDRRLSQLVEQRQVAHEPTFSTTNRCDSPNSRNGVRSAAWSTARSTRPSDGARAMMLSYAPKIRVWYTTRSGSPSMRRMRSRLR